MLFYRGNFKILRESKKLTQEELGKKVSRTRQSIDNYENGKNKPSPSVVYDLAKALSCSIYDISDLKPKDDDPALKGNDTKSSECSFFENCPIEKGDRLCLEIIETCKELSRAKKIELLGFAERLKNGGEREMPLEELQAKAG